MLFGKELPEGNLQIGGQFCKTCADREKKREKREKMKNLNKVKKTKNKAKLKKERKGNDKRLRTVGKQL